MIKDLNGPIALAAIYSPPRHRLTENDFKTCFQSLVNRFIAGGDYNAKHQLWGSRLSTTRGRILHKVIQENNLNFRSTGEPTYWPTDTRKTPDVPDFFITKGGITENISIQSCWKLCSDHSPIIAKVSSSIINKKKPLTLQKHLTYWSYFRDQITEKVSLNLYLKTEEEEDEAIEKL